MSWHEWREAPAGDYAVIGDPISHSLSPRIHSAAYEALGLNLSYQAFRVPIDEFNQAVEQLKSLGYKGLNVTVPLKEAAQNWVGEGKYGALNTLCLHSQTGINTDVPAFMQTLIENKVNPGAKLAFLGAGGTARALLVGVHEAGYEISVWNRTPQKLDDLLREIGISARILPDADPIGADAVINATSASISGLGIAVEWRNVNPDCLAYDLGYTNGMTPFLADAFVSGCRVLDGKPMLVEQAALAFEWWLKKTAPREAMLTSVEL
ncbi:MAG: shikimate dehydrogenase [Fimbriimonadaceae bacterium]|nr:MAG: shikimate dehydrogenase [Fimbriimonadaceae bacterium]